MRASSVARFILFCWISSTLATQALAELTFNLTFTDNALANYNTSQQQLFQDGINFWDAIIDGHQDGANRTWDLEVDSFNSEPVSTGGGTSILLGSAGPGTVGGTGVVAGAPTSNERFIVSLSGQASFNTNPAANLTLDTIKHEIGHALGIGTLWEDNEVYNDGVANNSNRTLLGGTPGQYVGAEALLAFQNEFVGQSAATFIPVELSGGPGTAHGHWDESDDFGATNTGLVDMQGRDLRFELFTGFAAPGEDFLSNFSRRSLVDIGFTLEAVSVPEPTSIAVLAFASGAILVRRRRVTC